ncbi:unnamed protein product [Sympodiomycopsis kandeliae]
MKPSSSASSLMRCISSTSQVSSSASSSRLVVSRNFHSTITSRNDKNQGSSSNSSNGGSRPQGFAGLASVIDKSLESGSSSVPSGGQRTRFGIGNTEGGGGLGGRSSSFAVSTPGAGSQSSARGASPLGSNVRPRRAVAGQMVSPNELTYDSLATTKPMPARPLLGPTKREALQYDQIHKIGLNPGKPSLHDDSYKNGALLGAYCSELGKIQPRATTRLTIKSQRKVAKAIRRAKSMGILPVLSNSHQWGS